jgi:hypothetical protein
MSMHNLDPQSAQGERAGEKGAPDHLALHSIHVEQTTKVLHRHPANERNRNHDRIPAIMSVSGIATDHA